MLSETKSASGGKNKITFLCAKKSNILILFAMLLSFECNATGIGIKILPTFSYSFSESSIRYGNKLWLKEKLIVNPPSFNYSAKDMNNVLLESMGGFVGGVLSFVPTTLLGYGLALTFCKIGMDKNDAYMFVPFTSFFLSPISIPIGTAKGIEFVGKDLPHGGSYRKALLGSFLGVFPGAFYGVMTGVALNRSTSGLSLGGLATSIGVGMIPVITGGVIGYNLESPGSIFNKKTFAGALIGAAIGASAGAIINSDNNAVGAWNGLGAGIIAGSIIGYNFNF